MAALRVLCTPKKHKQVKNLKRKILKKWKTMCTSIFTALILCVLPANLHVACVTELVQLMGLLSRQHKEGFIDEAQTASVHPAGLHIQ